MYRDDRHKHDYEDEERLDKLSNTSFVLSLVSLIAWLLPIIGIPLSILGLTLGIKSSDRPKSIVATIICSITLLVGGINSYVGIQQRSAQNQSNTDTNYSSDDTTDTTDYSDPYYNN